MTDRWTWHGGGLAAARAAYGDSSEPWIDLSTGINPHPWPIPSLDLDWTRLPDEANLRALEAAAADHFGVAADHVCAVPGTEVGMRLTGALCSAPAWWIEPCYSTHADMIAGARPLRWENRAAADGATLILANPSNPDGRLLDQVALRDLLDRRGRNGRLLLDEAYADTLDGASVASWAASDDRLILFRSFGKFFGLAGVRLGFVIAQPSFLTQLRRSLGAWPLSAAALAIGTAAYRDNAWMELTRARLSERANSLDAALRDIGAKPQGACPLFRLIHVGDANALFDRLARRHILTRPFDHKPAWLRIGLPADADALSRLISGIANG